MAGITYFSALDPRIGVGYDDGHYVALARALAQGKGYSQAYVPGNPPESQYPPGYPLLLSLVWLVAPDFPGNAVGFKVVSAAAALVFAALVYGWMRWRKENTFLAVSAILLTLFNPLIFGLATSAYSEMGFGACTVLALWTIEWYDSLDKAEWRGLLAATVAIAAAFYVRTFGLALVGAGVLYLLAQSHRPKAFALGAASLIVVAPWFVRNAFLPGDGYGYSQQFLLRSMEQPELGTISGLELIVRVVLNLRAYLLAGLPGAIMPSQVPLTFVNLDSGLRVGSPFLGSDLVLAVLVVGALLSQMAFRRALADYYVAIYLGIGLLWPWEPTRFLVPLIPLLYTSLGSFGAELVKGMGKYPSTWRLTQYVSVGALGVFLAANVWTLFTFAMSTRLQVEPPEWSARQQLFDWLKAKTPEDALLAAMNDTQVYLYSGRAVVRELGTFDRITQSHVDYVVLIPYGGVMVEGDLSRMRFDPVNRAHPESFRLLYDDAANSMRVLRVQ